jgi:biopolymer transport protein TolQ
MLWLTLPVFPLFIGTGLMFALTEATWEGKVILMVLFIGSIFSWSVMVTKMRTLRFARQQSDRFSALFRRDREPMRIYEQEVHFEGSPLYSIYRAGCDELCFQLLGSTEVDETFRARITAATKITPSQMRAVTAAMERAVGESALRLESLMNILSMAVSGAPFIGLLGTVWGVMDAFSGIAMAGNANLSAMAPGVSGALVTTVVGLLVAIPAMFGYNFLVGSVRSMVVRSDNFAAELASSFEHRFVSHQRDAQDL